MRPLWAAKFVSLDGTQLDLDGTHPNLPPGPTWMPFGQFTKATCILGDLRQKLAWRVYIGLRVEIDRGDVQNGLRHARWAAAVCSGRGADGVGGTTGIWMCWRGERTAKEDEGRLMACFHIMYCMLCHIVDGWEINCYLNTLVALATKK